VVVDSAGHGRCTRQFARSARKSAKSRLNPEMIVRYTAGIAIQSARKKAVKRRDFVIELQGDQREKTMHRGQEDTLLL